MADVPIEVDGGIEPSTIANAHAAGANVFVAGSFLAQAVDVATAMGELRERCGS